jgi:hypothetical protein
MREVNRARRRLRNLKVHEISLVERGDDPGAVVAFYKQRTEEPKMTRLEKALARNEDAYSVIEKLARERVLKHGHGKTREQAVLELLQEDPQLYQDYLEAVSSPSVGE